MSCYLKMYSFFWVTVFLICNELLDQRLVVGYEATPHSSPYMVGIYQDNNDLSRCGGALISEDFVITAAQCVVGHLLHVILGAHDFVSHENRKITLRIREKDKRVHPEYDSYNVLNNIALLKLPEKIVFSTYIDKIGMVSEYGELFIGQSAIFTGWGIEGITSLFSQNKLHQVNVKVLNYRCNRILRTVQPTEICTNPYLGFITGRGHAGSPLVIRERYGRSGENGMLIGLSSLKATLFHFAVPKFTRISSFRKWIDETMLNATELVPTTVPPTTTTVPPAPTTQPPSVTSIPPKQTTFPPTSSAIPPTSSAIPPTTTTIFPTTTTIPPTTTPIPLVTSTNHWVPSTIPPST